jgi:hypothetical protein
MVPVQSSGGAQALGKILSPAIVECTNGIIDLRVLAECRALAAPHCTTYKAFELVRFGIRHRDNIMNNLQLFGTTHQAALQFESGSCLASSNV